jgi:hypothetical protein
MPNGRGDGTKHRRRSKDARKNCDPQHHIGHGNPPTITKHCPASPLAANQFPVLASGYCPSGAAAGKPPTPAQRSLPRCASCDERHSETAKPYLNKSNTRVGRTTMKTILAAIIALSALAGVATSASAYSNYESHYTINWSTGQGS